MSPEQALGKPLDARTDIFSLGVVLYEMITGCRAFDGDTSAAVFDAILNRAPTAPVELNALVPAELERIVNKALEKNPDLRYQSAADFCADLRRFRRDSSAGRTGRASRPSAGRSHSRWLRNTGVAIASIVAVLAAVALWLAANRAVSTESSSSTDGAVLQSIAASSAGPSIAVLPFENAGGDEDQKYFSDGLTEDIITELSGYHELSVIAHSSTRHYTGSDIDIRKIGAELGVRYVLRGSVRRAGQWIKVGVQLSDTSDSRLVWGTNYERELTASNLFALQDELTQQVVSAIADTYGALARAELPSARRKPPASLDSYDCVLRVYAYLQSHLPQNHLAARDCLEQVIATDPDYAAGRAWLAYLYAEEFHHRWNERPDDYDALDRALEMATEAERLDPASHVSHGALALALFFRGETERARIESYRTIDLSPNNALWLGLLANYLAAQEDFEHAVPMSRKALALSPHPPRWIHMPVFLEHYRRGEYEEALHRAKEIELEDFRTPLFLVATYGQLGRVDAVDTLLDQMRSRWRQRLDRPLVVREIRRELIERNVFSPGAADHLLEGLMKAGFEPAAESSAPRVR
ncbi:MAG: hypothetical protein JSV80_08055 [Acidobacteriota bacterium]|nr:MAG: hypothetical protein JSV80_08055 [Acidobacteriota bacterium]